MADREVELGARGLFIAGEWQKASGGDSIAVDEAASGEVMARVATAGPDDVDRAVAAAHAALEGWRRAGTETRAGLVAKLGEALEGRKEELARSIAREVGTPIRQARAPQVSNAVSIIEATVAAAGLCDEIETIGNARVLLESAGVVGAITPWNFPLQQVAAKVAPALVAGCTVVLKASEVAPLTAFALAEMASELEFPAGVLNVLTGLGPVAGEALVSHPLVDRISFTGSSRAGRRVSELASHRVVPVTLELGGKSPSVVLEDADVERAAKFAVYNAFLNNGQTCTALTRLLVPASRCDQAAEVAAQTAQRLAPEDPLEEGCRLGPLASAPQLDRVRGYIRKGIAEGATLACGGPEAPPGLERGYYVQGTVFSRVDPESTIAQEEIFGPVLSVIPYRDEEEAVRIANGTPYGLAAAVWSADQERALAFAGRLRSGTVEVNGGLFNTAAPFGGVKQSGHGREFGRHGLAEFLVTKTLQL